MSATSLTPQTPVGWWRPEAGSPENDDRTFHDALRKPTEPIYIIEKNGLPSVRHSGTILVGMNSVGQEKCYPLLAYAPALLPESLGDTVFKKTHGLRYPLVAGAMANGITSVQMLEAMGRSGMIGFFGAGGLTLEQIETAIHQVKGTMEGFPYGFNLIHSPYDPALESATVALYLRQGIRRVSAAAFMDLTLPLIHYRLKGIHRHVDGHVVCPNHVFAKVSRIEVARKFLSPHPRK